MLAVSSWNYSHTYLDAVDIAVGGGDIDSALARPAAQMPASKLPFDVVAGLPGGVGMATLLTGHDRHAGRCGQPAVGAHGGHHLTDHRVEDLRPLGQPATGYADSLLATAERVVGVCEATPRGVLRYVDWLADSQPAVQVLTVMNEVPGQRISPNEIADQLRSLSGDRVNVVASAPYDRRVVAGEWAPPPTSGPFTRALEQVAAATTTYSAAAATDRVSS